MLPHGSELPALCFYISLCKLPAALAISRHTGGGVGGTPGSELRSSGLLAALLPAGLYLEAGTAFLSVCTSELSYFEKILFILFSINVSFCFTSVL